mmetsp:Transcript_6814/g.19319  ORF Transcript_6814/g.19319 Transcript_6814/m.19319 type:complete len:232 (+) Transcript_6814:3-698(+)
MLGIREGEGSPAGRSSRGSEAQGIVGHDGGRVGLAPQAQRHLPPGLCEHERRQEPSAPLVRVHAILCDVAPAPQRSAAEGREGIDDSCVGKHLCWHLLPRPLRLLLQRVVDLPRRVLRNPRHGPLQLLSDHGLLNVKRAVLVDRRRSDKKDYRPGREALQEVEAKVYVVLGESLTIPIAFLRIVGAQRRHHEVWAPLPRFFVSALIPVWLVREFLSRRTCHSEVSDLHLQL